MSQQTIKGVTITHSPSNCKLSYVDHVRYREKATIDEVLKSCRQTVYMTLTSEDRKNYILKNYETYFCQPVPVGYDGPKDMVWHILIRNTLTTSNKDYLRPVLKKEHNGLNMKEVKTKFLEVFKSKRRKTDIVNDLLKVIKQ